MSNTHTGFPVAGTIFANSLDTSKTLTAKIYITTKQGASL
jgi:hypothetical protein